MRVVGTCDGIDILAPDDAYFSYFNSPYIGHRRGAAVDIYPPHQTWGETVQSPAAGTIVDIKQMKMGRPREFPTEEVDFAIGIQPSPDDDALVRIMHCAPDVNVGDTVDAGDSIGTALRSRYFQYWTGPHYHVEILSHDDFNRASKSRRLSVSMGRVTSKPVKRRDTLTAEVLSVSSDRVIVHSKDLPRASSRDLVGLAGSTADCGVTGILDGGFSYYDHGGLIGNGDLVRGCPLFLLSHCVGELDSTFCDAHHFARKGVLDISLDGYHVRGLSSFVYPLRSIRRGKLPVVIVPSRYDQFRDVMAEGDVCEVRINSVIAETHK
ncbi:MAG: hypothetical protein ACP6KW_04040 [Candidatus Thorarchaeota archaeon]